MLTWQEFLAQRLEEAANGPPKSEEGIKKAQEKPGGSNVGEKRETSGPKEGPFCGPAGGAPAGSYPVTSAKQGRAAKAYARHAPNPQKIKQCVDRIVKARGWNQ